jgi:pyridoxamine 5'-phosphate oxidase
VDVKPSTTTNSQLPGMRVEYSGELVEGDLPPDWSTLFGSWLTEAIDAGVPEPNAMVLATADADGRPSARNVLLKGFDQRGFTFFTNYESRKGRQLAVNPRASLVFNWYPLHRQVIVAGDVEKVDRAETEEYFAVRPRGAQLGAWASPQSQVLESRDELERAWAEAGERFGDIEPVPPPPHWGGYRVLPESVEFWQGRRSRLHDRLRYRYTGMNWIVERLAP